VTSSEATRPISENTAFAHWIARNKQCIYSVLLSDDVTGMNRCKSNCNLTTQ